MADIKREYTNGEVTVIWQAAKCIHAASCFRELPEVFDPSQRPWINMEGADTDRIIKQVKRCPTDALTYYMNKEKEQENNPQITEVEVLKDGPVLVKGKLNYKDNKGNSKEIEGVMALCRCGASKTKPFCDGTHHHIGFSDDK
jgi:uncharacterized Fe-S cluster protein YjdI